MTRTARRQAWSALGLTAALLLTVTACSSDEPAPPPPKSSTDAKPSKEADPQTAEERAALQAYKHALEEGAKAMAQASSKGTNLTKYVALKEEAQQELQLKQMRESGQITTGTRKSDPKITALDARKEIPEARVSDCLDIRDWHLVDKKTKKEVDLPSERLLRYVSVAEMEKWDKGWVVTSVEHQEQKC